MNNLGLYLNICRNAVTDDSVFAKFKSIKEYTWALEHVSQEFGLEYLEVIKDEFPNFKRYIRRFVRNDRIGNPTKYWYADVRRNVSPTTLRYVKVLSDIINNFDTLDGKDIVEIGCGYGGQCKIIHDYFKPKSYTIIDLPDVLLLAEKYVGEFGIKPILRIPQETTSTGYDFFISNYAFTEVPRAEQMFYAEHIIKHSKSGYMTCNFMIDRECGGRMRKEEIMALQDGCVIDEIPLTGSKGSSFIYLWGCHEQNDK